MTLGLNLHEVAAVIKSRVSMKRFSIMRATESNPRYRGCVHVVQIPGTVYVSLALRYPESLGNSGIFTQSSGYLEIKVKDCLFNLH